MILNVLVIYQIILLKFLLFSSSTSLSHSCTPESTKKVIQLHCNAQFCFISPCLQKCRCVGLWGFIIINIEDVSSSSVFMYPQQRTPAASFTSIYNYNPHTHNQKSKQCTCRAIIFYHILEEISMTGGFRCPYLTAAQHHIRNQSASNRLQVQRSGNV